MNHFITKRSQINIDSKELKYTLIDLLVNHGEISINMFWYFEIEKDIQTTESKVVEKTQEKYAERC